MNNIFCKISILRFSKSLFALILLVFITLQSCKKNKDKVTPNGQITGVVLSKDGLPISGVKVTLDNLNQSYVFSDSNGRYTFEHIAIGDYSIIAAKEKYLSESKTVIVSQDGVTKLDFYLTVGEATLDVEKENYDFPYTNITSTINIKSNTAWMVTISANWLTLDNSIGLGNNTIKIVANENQSDQARSATLTITSGTIVKIINITQFPKVRLLSVSLTQPITDTVILTFSSSVDEVQIISNYENCVSDLAYNRKPMSKEVRFKYTCARLGQSFPFKVIAKDKVMTYSENFNVDFFSKRIVNPAVWSQGPPTYFITDDNKTVWFSIFDTKVVQKIDIETFAIKGNYNVSFKVRKLVYNPYNKLIYILTNTPDIYVMNPDDGAIIKHIKLGFLEGDASSYPTVFPKTLAFTNSGVGAMICGSDNSDATSWKMIDSRKDDLVYYNKHKDKYNDYGKIEVNYDRTKLILKASFSNLLFSFDPIQDVIKDITIPVHGALGFIVPNKKNDNLYLVQTYEQYIYNPVNNYLSYVTYLENGCAADFSYKAGEDEVVYVFDTNNYLKVLNYKTQKTLHYFPTINEFYYGKPISTTDGKYLINFTNFTLFRFDTELFTTKVFASKNMSKTTNAFIKHSF